MRICFDARTIRAEMTGVGVYSSRLLSQMLAAGGERQWVLPHLPGAPLEFCGGRTDIERVETRADYGNHPAGEWWLNVTLLRLLQRSGADLFHGPAYLIPWRRTHAKKIVTIHDLAFFRFPQHFPARYGWYIRQATRLGARAADGIIAVSRCTAKDLVELCGVPERKIRVIYEAPDSAMKPATPEAVEAARRSYGLREPYLLCVGTLEPRKGALAAIGVLERLRAGSGLGIRGSGFGDRGLGIGDRDSGLGIRDSTFGEPGIGKLSLVWAGKTGWRAGPLVKAFEASPERAHLLRLDYVPNEQLAALYGGAEALLYLSEYEGFGIPPLEAMACGCPVISSNRASLSEVVGEGGIQLAPDDAQGVVDILTQWANDRGARREMIERGHKQAAKFSWAKAAQETLQYYEDICSWK